MHKEYVPDMREGKGNSERKKIVNGMNEKLNIGESLMTNLRKVIAKREREREREYLFNSKQIEISNEIL